jgi:hypothetical protein
MKKRELWDALLDEVRDPQVLFSGPAYGGLLRLLTLNGRLPYHLGAAGLTHRELVVLQHMLGRDSFVLAAPDDPEFARCTVVVAHSALGKLTLHEPERGDEPQPEEIVGGLHLPSWLMEMVDEECAAAEPLERYEQSQVDALLRAWAGEGTLETRVRQVMDWVDRVETVLVYCGRRIFSKSDAGTNTLLRENVLAALCGRDPDEWAVEERLFVAAAQLLFRTGRAVRFEEFNGRQLTATALRALLSRRCVNYFEALGAAPGADLRARSLSELADLIGDAVPKIDGSDWLRYRRINGISYVKTEYLERVPVRGRRPEGVPPLLARLAADDYGIRAGLDDDPVELTRRLTEQAARDAQESGDSAQLERILESVVLSAVLETGSDYGMSSGLRKLARLFPAEGGTLMDSVLTLKKQDFFCCTLPSPAAADALPQERMTEVLWLVAQRMMYNRWHFVPGNFDRAQVPLSRHYFFPPLVPDISEWGDVRHGGHAASSVRYSIRAPGAQMWREPFRVAGHDYRGCYDIRLVRMDGQPYERDDVRMASRYCALVDGFWRALAEHVEWRGGASLEILGYTSDWYASATWRRSLPQFVDGEPRLVG